MPSLLSSHGSHGSKRLRKANTGDAGARGKTTITTATTEESGGTGVEAEEKQPRTSFVSFITRNSSTTSVSKLQRTESWKRRFGLNILTRGRNKNTTFAGGSVSSQAGDVRHQSSGTSGATKLGARSKEWVLPPIDFSAHQISAPEVTAVTVTRTPSKLQKARPTSSSANNNKNTLSRLVASNPPSAIGAQALSGPAPPSVPSGPSSKQQQQQQQQSPAPAPAPPQPQPEEMAATTTTTTTVMQEPMRRSFSLTLTVDELPRHSQSQTSSQSPPHPSHPSHSIPRHHRPSAPQQSSFSSSSAASLSSPPPPPPANEKQTPMSNATQPLLPSTFTTPVASKHATNGYSRTSPELSKQIPAASIGFSETISTPVSDYITPSQTPTLQGRPEQGFESAPVPTVLRPGPSTPPLTESSASLSSQTKLIIVADPNNQAENWQGTNNHAGTPEDTSFGDGGPPTPASSVSSRTTPGKKVNFIDPTSTTPTSSIRSVGSNVGSIYPHLPSQHRLNNYRPAPSRPMNHPRNYGPSQLPLRGPPRGGMALRPPQSQTPRPPSPIYMNPPSMKRHIWTPLNTIQVDCAAGHTLQPFKNKQHSIMCSVCRSMEFEGRGEPVKRSFYCTWCAIRMCGDCKEELVEGCNGSLTELWDKTEEKRTKNMEIMKSASGKAKRESVSPKEQEKNVGNRDSFGSRLAAAINPGDRQNGVPEGDPSAIPSDFPFPAQKPAPQEQSRPQQSRTPQPQQSTPQPQQSKTPQPQTRTPQPEQQRTQRRQRNSLPEQPRIPQLEQLKSSQQQQPGVPQPQQSKTLQPQQSRTPQPQQSRTPRPEQSRTPQPQQSRTPRPEQSRTPRPEQSRTPQPQILRTPRPEQSRTPQPQQSRTPQVSRILQPHQSGAPRQSMEQRPSDRKPVSQQPRPTNKSPRVPEKLTQDSPYPRGPNRISSNFPNPAAMSSLPLLPQLTPAETERYKLIPVASHQKPPSSGTVVLVGEKEKTPSITGGSLKGSLKKKRTWFRGFGKKKEV